MRTYIALAAAAAFVCSAANATEASRTSTDAKRVVYQCDDSPSTKRSFERKHGEMIFATAEEARSSSWTGARCMTRNEYQKLKRLELKQLASR